MMECSIKRQDLVNVSSACPERPYVELEIPSNAQTINHVRFTITSHDQGWCTRDHNGPPYEASYTWFAAYAKRARGQKDPQQERVQTNRRGDENFRTHTVRWTNDDSGTSTSNWVMSLKAGDTIQLLARAHYPGWVNIVQEAEIHIEYEPRIDIQQGSVSDVMHPGHSDNSHYRGLDQDSHEIRLLVIHPGAFDDPIHCSLVHSPLIGDRRIEFEALSYCWGDATNRALISIRPLEQSVVDESQHFSVTRSAEAAIRYLRHNDGRSRTLWIDAVCINQGDLEERGRQVSMMAEIYSKADQVDIWLGESSRESDLAMKIIRETFNSRKSICAGSEKCKCSGMPHTLRLGEHELSENLFQRILKIYDLLSDTSILGGRTLYEIMTSLFGNPWFRRVWVFQEALGCPNAVIHCGHKWIPWNELTEVNMYLESVENKYLALHLSPQAVMPSLWTNLVRAKQLNKEKPTSDADVSSYVSDPGILDVYLAALDLEATDPRDKLFALLSFGKETRLPSQLASEICPNYKKSEKQIFADFTRWWIREHRSLRILSAVHGQAGRTWQSLHCPNNAPTPLTRPTWAIGYDGKTRWARATLQTRFGYRAASDTAVVVVDDTTLSPCRQSPLVLSLAGFRVAEIKQIAHLPLRHLQNELPGLYDAFLAIFDPSFYALSWGSAMNDSWNRSGTVSEAVGARVRLEEHLEAHWTYGPRPKIDVVDINSHPDENGRFQLMQSDETLPCVERCFFVASDGRAGLCPAGAREGDVVVILLGGNVPFLLRDAHGVAGGPQFELVGECYLQGIMNGEYIQEQRERRAVPEVFSLV